MARDFDGSTDRIDYASISDLNETFTIAMWVYPETLSGNQYLWHVHPSGDSSPGCAIWNNTSTHLRITLGSGLTMYRQVDNFFTASQWQHLTISCDGTGDETGLKIYKNGTEQSYSGGSSGTLIALTGSWSLAGRIYDDSRNFDTRIAEVAYWNRVLSDAEIAGLGQGFSPLFYPESLLWCPDLIRGTTDKLGNAASTVDGTTVVEHPPVIYPARPQILIPPVVASATILPQIMQQYYYG